MKFEKDYFIDSKISNYKDYTKKQYYHLFVDLTGELDIKKTDKILDFGCATGNLVKEFLNNGYLNIKGTDISDFAINHAKTNADMSNKIFYYNRDLLTSEQDWIIMLDVLEHIDTDELHRIFMLLYKYTPKKGLIFRIPVSYVEGEHFVLAVSREDKTHIQVHTKEWWIELFNKYEFKVDKEFKNVSIFSSIGVFTGVLKCVEK